MAYYISSGQVSSGIILNNDNLYVSSGGMVNSTAVNSCGQVHVSSGGSANRTTVNYSGYLLISSGGWASNTTLNTLGCLTIYRGGVANDTTMYEGGFLSISSGGTANDITMNGGAMSVCDGVANDTNLNKGGMFIENGGTANNTIVNGYRNNSSYYTFLSISSGGVANGTTVMNDGLLIISGGGVAVGTMVNSGGRLYVSSGGKATGLLNIESGGSVAVYHGIVDFDISGKTAESSALVNNLSLIQGTPDFTITVSATQKAGSYTLAGGAAGFTGTLTIGTLETNYGTITVNGNALTYGDYTYTLATDQGNLSLKIANGRIYETPSLIVTTADDVVDETDGVTSLREAIAYAAVLDGEQTITFKISDADIIQLNETLDIASSVVIDGQNAGTENNVTIRVAVTDAEARQSNLSASNYDLLNVSGADHFTLNNLTLMGGAGNVAVFSETVDYFHSDGLTIKDSYGMFSLSEMIQRGEVDHFYSVNCVQGINFGKNSIVRNSTFDGSMLPQNENNGNGGPLTAGPLGLYSTMTVINSTLLNHDVPHSGAAIYVQNQLVNLVNCTIENACGHLGIGNSLCSVLGGTFNLLNTIVVTPDGSGIPDIGAAFGSTNTIRYSVYGAAGNSIASNSYPGYDSEDLFVSVGQTSDNGGVTPTLALRSDATVLDNAVLAAVDPETHTLYYSTDNGSSWLLYSDRSAATVNPDWIIDTDQNGISRLTGNKIGASVVCGNSIESMIPDKPTASADITTATNQNVTVSARFSNDAVIKQYSLDNINWSAYTKGIVMSMNGTVYFRAGNDYGYSEVASYTVGNIDKSVPVLTGEPSASINGRNVSITWSAASDNTSVTGYQIKIGNNTYSTTGTSYSLTALAAGTYTYQIRACDTANNYSEWSNARSFQIVPTPAQASVFFYNGNSLISSGTILNNLIVSSGCSVYVSSGGTATGTTINSGGSMYVSSGGLADRTTLNGGSMYVSSGGTATIAYDPRGRWYYSINSVAGATVTYLKPDANIYCYSSGVLSKYDSLENFEITSGKSVYITGGTALGITVNGGSLTVSSGGTATIAYNNPWRRGYVYSSAGAVVNYTADANIYYGNSSSGVLSKYDRLENFEITSGNSVVAVGGTAANITVGSEGVLIVRSGGTATSTTVNRGGSMTVAGTANVTTVSSGGVYVQDGTANNTTLNKSSWMDVDGGTANNTTVNSGGYLYVSSGGMAANTIINSGGAMSIIGEDMMQEHCDLGPMATNTTVNSGGCLHLEGGIGNNISVNAGGRLMIGYGKVKGSLQIASGAYVTAAMGGIMEFDISGRTANSSALVNDLSLIDRAIFLYTITISATQANGTYTLAGGASDFNDTFNIGTAETNYGELTVNGAVLTYGDYNYTLAVAGGNLLLNVAKTVRDLLLINSAFNVLSGATANDTNIGSGGGLHVYNGGTARNTVVSSGGYLGIGGGGKVTGSLQIADGAVVSAYGGSIVDFDISDRTADSRALINDLSLISGTPDYAITVAADQSNGVYTLADGAAGFGETITICNTDGVCGSLAVGGSVTLGDRDYALNLNSSLLTLTVSGGAPIPPTPVVGTVGDLNMDGRADIVMTIDQGGHPADGSTGAWLIQADQTAAWGNLSTRVAGWEIFGTGKTVAGKNTDDVYIRNVDNVIGAWTTDDEGKVKGWETIGEFSADTQIVGLGDFNGNGQTDLLLRNTNGAVGCFFTGGEKTGWNYFQSLGEEWKLCAIGDLNGDGRDDVVLKHDAGIAGSWLTQSNGTMAWADLDTLPGGFEIVGAGDFNGDGTDDVLLKSGGYYGAWLVNNGNASGWMGLGNLGDVTVEQIADFNGDGVDDLRIRTSAGDLGAQLVMGTDTLDWHYYGSVGEEWKTSLAAFS